MNSSQHTKQSKNHHWFPFGLQRYWEDNERRLSLLKLDGQIERKRVKRKNNTMGSTFHGHTYGRETDWSVNFEDAFGTIDDKVHEVIGSLKETVPDRFISIPPRRPEFFQGTLRFLGQQQLADISFFAISLLLRRPGFVRSIRQGLSRHGMEVSRDLEKMNLAQAYGHARRSLESADSPLSLRIVVLHSISGEFFFTDSGIDQMSHSLMSDRLSGKALLPITPETAIYLNASASTQAIEGRRFLTSAFVDRRVVGMVQSLTTASAEYIYFRKEVPNIGSGLNPKEMNSMVNNLYSGLDALHQNVLDHSLQQIRPTFPSDPL